MLPFANPALARAGFLAVAISVRHSGQAVFPAQLHDVQAAVRWLRLNPLGLPVASDRIGIWGQSAGGHLAAMAGLNPSGASRTGDGVGGDVSTHREQLRAASPLTHVTSGAPPFLIIHGTSDETVPYEQAKRLHRALLEAGTEASLLPIVGGHHNLRHDPHARYGGTVWYDVAGEVVRFFRRHLLTRGKTDG